MGEPEGEGAIHSPLPFVYRLQQSPMTFGFLIHQPYLSLAFTLPSLSAPGPKPVTGLGWARLALGPRAKGIGLGQPSRAAPPSPTSSPVVGPEETVALWLHLCIYLYPFLPGLFHSSISFWEPGAQPNMERAETIVQCISQWPVEPNIRLGEGHSWRRIWELGFGQTALSRGCESSRQH